ncbi:MAG: FtsW/RodA/SpoVE family cell cycle protein, partial [Clostridia bacterium]|nr:FtsW/RodA/SpoVE family cell cycle protein [Clostridia bacterium]
MRTDGKEKKAIVKSSEKGVTVSDKAKGKRYTSGKSGVVITGGKPSRFNRYSVVPTDEKLKKLEEKRRENERADIEWERGVIRTKSGVDRLLLVLILLLTVIGLIALFSASYPLSIYESSRKEGAVITGTAYIQRQLMFTGFGFIVMFLISRIPYNFYRNYGIVFYGVVFVLLILAIFIGHGGTESATESGVRRWIGIQGTPYNIQPSELMKSALVMMLAKHYETHREVTLDYDDKRNSYISGVVVPLVIVGASAVAVAAGSHLSGMIVVGFIGFCVMITAGAHAGKAILTVLGVGIPAGIVFLIAKPYALARITTFFSSDPDVLGADW